MKKAGARGAPANGKVGRYVTNNRFYYTAKNAPPTVRGVTQDPTGMQGDCTMIRRVFLAGMVLIAAAAALVAMRPAPRQETGTASGAVMVRAQVRNPAKSPTPIPTPSPTQPVCRRVTAHGLHIRAGASVAAPVVGYLSHGDIITTTRPITSSWARIAQGWVNIHFTEESQCSKK